PGVFDQPERHVDVAHHARSAARAARERVVGGGELDGGGAGEGPKQADGSRGLAGAARRTGNGEKHQGKSFGSGARRTDVFIISRRRRFWKATAPRMSAAPAHCRGPSRSPSRVSERPIVTSTSRELSTAARAGPMRVRPD